MNIVYKSIFFLIGTFACLESSFAKTLDQRIQTAPGNFLESRLYLPDEERFASPRPTLILASSWALNKFEYEIQAQKFADEGFLVLTYSPRGFGGSDGFVSAAGPDDVADISRLIDWLFTNASVDQNRVAFIGISYGGGLGMLAATQDDRIKTVVSMSGWADLCESLYSNHTLHSEWVNILLVTGMLSGRLDPEINRHVANVNQGVGLAEFQNWCGQRSPINSIDALNQRKVPVFLSSNYDDELFASKQTINFFEKLEGPKKMLLAKGIHFSGEISGLLGLPSEIWDNTHAWVKNWLDSPDPAFTYGYNLTMTSGTEHFAALPVQKKVEGLDFRPKNAVKDGGIVFDAGKDSGANSNLVPVLSSVLHAHLDIDRVQIMSLVDPMHSAIYETLPVRSMTKLRGLPRIQYYVAPHESAMTMVAYLYDVDENGKGKLLSHGVYSFVEGSNDPAFVDLSMNFVVMDIELGHRLSLVIDGLDPLYLSQGRNGDGKVELLHLGDQKLQVSLPLSN